MPWQTLTVWYEYTQERKQKAARLELALVQRQTRLVREGVTKWLAVAADLADIRQRFAAQRGAEVTLILYGLFHLFCEVAITMFIYCCSTK